MVCGLGQGRDLNKFIFAMIETCGAMLLWWYIVCLCFSCAFGSSYNGYLFTLTVMVIGSCEV